MPFSTIPIGVRGDQITPCPRCGIEMQCPTCEFGAAHVPGVEYNAFHEQASEISPELAPYLLQTIRARMDADFVLADGGLCSTVQLIGTLFEAIAALAVMYSDATDEGRAKLHVLRRHAVEGVNLIDAGSER